MALDGARRALRWIGGGWAFVICVDAILIRTHVLTGTYTGYAVAAGFVAGGPAIAVWHGFADKPHGTTRNGRRLISARSFTGVRTVELEELVSVRRFSAIARYGTVDEYHVKDRHGVRVTLPRGRDRTIDDAVRWAVTRRTRPPGMPPLKVTRHARSALSLEPRSRVLQFVHMVWGLLVMFAALGIPALASYIIACLLAGTT